eukprot:5700334-Alexandrium_andersonii.AAC.1
MRCRVLPRAAADCRVPPRFAARCRMLSHAAAYRSCLQADRTSSTACASGFACTCKPAGCGP